MTALHNEPDLGNPHELELLAGRLGDKARLYADMAEQAKMEARELRERADRLRRQRSRSFYVTVEPPKPKRRHTANARELVRDIGCELGSFTRQEVADAGPSYAAVRHWLDDYWVPRGTFKRTEVDGQYVYEFVPTESTIVNRPKTAPVELDVVRRAKAEEVAGSGRVQLSSNKIVNALVRQVAAQGVEAKKRKHKIEFIKDGRVIGSCSSTPGASSLKGTVGQLRQAGVNI